MARRRSTDKRRHECRCGRRERLRYVGLPTLTACFRESAGRPHSCRCQGFSSTVVRHRRRLVTLAGRHWSQPKRPRHHGRMWVVAAAWLLLLLTLSPARAHELAATITLSPPAVIVRAAYGGTDPVPFARVQVYSPAASTEFQTGVTDVRGNFSFLPDGPGDWRVVVDDEEGHRREVKVMVPRHFERAAQPEQAPSSRFERALLGVALLVGLTGFLYGFKARRSRS